MLKKTFILIHDSRKTCACPSLTGLGFPCIRNYSRNFTKLIPPHILGAVCNFARPVVSCRKTVCSSLSLSGTCWFVHPPRSRLCSQQLKLLSRPVLLLGRRWKTARPSNLESVERCLRQTRTLARPSILRCSMK